MSAAPTPNPASEPASPATAKHRSTPLGDRFCARGLVSRVVDQAGVEGQPVVGRPGLWVFGVEANHPGEHHADAVGRAPGRSGR